MPPEQPQAEPRTEGQEQAGEAAEEMTEQMRQAATVGAQSQEPYGTYLTDASGRTLYMFTADTRGQRSACEDACTAVWPPLLTDAEPSAQSAEVQSQMLGMIERPDGSMQVTYNGWPLYMFGRDQGPGDIQGQTMEGFGGAWYLVSPDGEPIEAQPEMQAQR
jgi:predicted lipoprotein with Yx(FWY)xxD motif